MTNIWLKVGGWVGRAVLAGALMILAPAARAELRVLSRCEDALTAILRSTGVLPDIGVVEAKGIFTRLEQLWAEEFAKAGIPFAPSELVVFTGAVITKGCGAVAAKSGPFYCPPDRKIYIDLSFWTTLEKWGALGAGARWYVLAHEYGHHVTELTGFLPKVLELQTTTFPGAKNALLALNELTADGLAGYALGRMAQAGMIGPSEFAEALHTARQVGDDAVQVRSYGYVYDRACFNHGTSEQRSEWLGKGLRSPTPWILNAFQDPGMKTRFPAFASALQSLVMQPHGDESTGRAAH